MKCATVVGALSLVAAVACEGGSATGEPVIDPGDGGDYRPVIADRSFVERIDNLFLPLIPGSRWVYESDDGEERVEVEVLRETRVVMGVTATVVKDTAFEDGEIVEMTYDWFAQDEDGNVWYLGEDSEEYEDGKPGSTVGSWEWGRDGAMPGIIMQAEPRAGVAYRQEHYRGEAEDMAEVLRTDGSEEVPAGRFEGLLVIREWTPLEPEVIEEKYYAAGVGLVLEVQVAGGEGRLGLVSFEAGE